MALGEQQSANETAADTRRRYRQTYEVEEIRGRCPIYKRGDKIVIDGRGFTEVINLELSDAVCMRATENMWATHAWQHGPDDIVNHLASVTGECRIACSMPGEPYTPCGYCIFRQSRVRIG